MIERLVIYTLLALCVGAFWVSTVLLIVSLASG